MEERLSYQSGSSGEPLLGETIGNSFDAAVAQYGDRLALSVYQQDIRWSYRELAAEVDGFAAGLIALGLEPGDRIGIWAPNCAEWIVTQYATAKAGLILVNINPAYQLKELEYALNKVGCRALITATQFKASNYIEMVATLVPQARTGSVGEWASEAIPSLEHIIEIGSATISGARPFSDVAGLAGEKDRERLSSLSEELQFDDPINIQFTSGTTGLPKGATLTHHNILNNGYFIGEILNYTQEDKVCVPVPLYHCFGMVIGSLACLTHGSAMILPGEGFDPEMTLKVISEEHCTSLYGVPTMFIAELNHPDFDTYDFSSLRTGVMAGSPCPIEVMRQCIDKMNLTEMTICYGMTETSPVSTQTRIGDALEKQVGTVGRVHPHIEIKIVDESGRIVPIGKSGELCTRGYSVMSGYWGDTEQTEAAIDKARWMHTGDLAVMDEDGYCSIVGRIKDMIIRGGENVYPREIEEYLYTHPDIEDVQVFGVADEKYGEEICAWIKSRDGVTVTVDQIREFCQGNIAHYKIPRYVECVDAFPMTVTGKVQKFVMRDQMNEKLATG